MRKSKKSNDIDLYDINVPHNLYNRVDLSNGIKVIAKDNDRHQLTFATLDDYDNFCWDMLGKVRVCSKPTDAQLDIAKRLCILVDGGAYDKKS